MDQKPNNAEPGTPQGRWCQFRLRTMLIVMVLLSIPLGYVGWQRMIVRERLALRDEIRGISGSHVGHHEGYIGRANPDANRFYIPWLRAKFGDSPYAFVQLPLNTPKEYRQRIRDAFPEAVVSSYKESRTKDGRSSVASIPFPDEPPQPEPDE